MIVSYEKTTTKVLLVTSNKNIKTISRQLKTMARKIANNECMQINALCTHTDMYEIKARYFMQISKQSMATYLTILIVAFLANSIYHLFPRVLE